MICHNLHFYTLHRSPDTYKDRYRKRSYSVRPSWSPCCDLQHKLCYGRAWSYYGCATTVWRSCRGRANDSRAMVPRLNNIKTSIFIPIFGRKCKCVYCKINFKRTAWEILTLWKKISSIRLVKMTFCRATACRATVARSSCLLSHSVQLQIYVRSKQLISVEEQM